MKRKQQKEEEESVKHGALDAKKLKADATTEEMADTAVVVVLDDIIDVEGFFEQDCDIAAQIKMRGPAERAGEIEAHDRGWDPRRESKSAESARRLLTGVDLSAPDEYDVTIKCVSGPYKGSTYHLKLDTQKHRSCLIGRSTGRKFRAPNGLSMPKDAELSTTHAQLRLEADGRVFFTDLDSTNGSYINDESVEPHEPHALSATEPNKVYVGGSDLVLTLTKRAGAATPVA